MAELTPNRSEVEIIKDKSQYLRGTLVQSLDNGITGALYPDDTQLIKFHGAYQQTDRDIDSERKTQKLEPLYSLMIRIRVPGGVATSKQWLRMDDLADRYGSGTLKLTTRQAFQLHGVSKRNLKSAIKGFNEVLLDSIAGCGDVNRNVMCSVNPQESRVHAAVQKVSEDLSRAFTPQTTAYAEIWLGGKPLHKDETDEEPIYGKTYLPRKFKIALAVPPQNDTDIYANDIGLVAVEKNGELQGFNVFAGGGLGMTFGMPDTFPRLADPLGYVATSEILNVCEAIITTQRDHGDRENRKFSRLKYTIERLGVDAFKAEVEKRAGLDFQDLHAFHFENTGDRYGWSVGYNGLYHLGLFIESGRVADANGYLLRTALREVAQVHDGEFRLTGNQNLVLSNIAPEKKAEIENILDQYGVLDKTFKQTALRQHSLACVALNTCTLAFAEAERYLPTLLDHVEVLLRKYGLETEPINIRMTGCPNGCARPYLAEIGLIGRGPGRYNLYLGAAHNGERLNKLYQEQLDETGILNTLDALFADFSKKRLVDEHFGDFVIRNGYVKATEQGRYFHD